MVNMGFQPAWKYQSVLELHLTGGQVIARRDRSAHFAAIRARITAGQAPDPDGPPGGEQWVSRTFTLHYDRSLPEEPGKRPGGRDVTG
jgi:hypothetical protein